jgi:hypothetical protein
MCRTKLFVTSQEHFTAYSRYGKVSKYTRFVMSLYSRQRPTTMCITILFADLQRWGWEQGACVYLCIILGDRGITQFENPCSIHH